MLFQEEQRIRKNILLLLVIIPLVVLAGALLFSQGNAGVIVVLLILLAVSAAIFVFIYSLKLLIAADTTGLFLQIKYFQLKNNHIPWNDIQQIRVKNISPMKDFGGWGLRYNGATTGYIFEGKKAILLHLKNGKTIAVTVRAADELMRLISSIHPELIHLS